MGKSNLERVGVWNVYEYDFIRNNRTKKIGVGHDFGTAWRQAFKAASKWCEDEEVRGSMAVNVFDARTFEVRGDSDFGCLVERVD